VWLAGFLSPQAQRWVTALAFFAFAWWALVPDRLEQPAGTRARSAFVAAAVAFFVAEMGDKTQLATIALAARYDALLPVVLGTTLGMMIANVPAVVVGEKLAGRIDMRLMRRVAAAAFALTGVAALL
jgi:putative Ca2+/H+ antiporter (TMEM165/GDT1 family)